MLVLGHLGVEPGNHLAGHLVRPSTIGRVSLGGLRGEDDQGERHLVAVTVLDEIVADVWVLIVLLASAPAPATLTATAPPETAAEAAIARASMVGAVSR